ncbi:MAG: hypothetical protein H6867_09260 [Rhodospirillales bacterium]|nr:hypothetical protein [Rhodospirillales bacterium]MCB9996012.1 hypothetical protein [Rhodospirillales bacterium]
MNNKKPFSSKKTGMVAGLFLCAALLFYSVSSHAQPTSTCDPEYMDALEAKAWLEAQREISQNKNFIFKPDSVLEYTCFDRFLDEAASNFAEHRQFSETDRWSGHPMHFSNTTTDRALTLVVSQPLQAYLTANFTTPGNMGDYLNNRKPGLERLPKAAVNGADYACAQMQRVWFAARCMNFNEQQENDFDGFFDFEYYELVDPREESNPWALMCTIPDWRITDARIEAFNGDQNLFDVGTEILPAQGNGNPYDEDDIITHLDLILPDPLCTGPAIPTGIMVQRPDILGGAQYTERVCTNPGCTNDPGTVVCNP